MKINLLKMKGWLINLKVKTKIMFGMCIMFSLLFIFSIIIIWTISEISRCQKLMEYSLVIINNMRMSRIYEKEFFLDKNQKSINDHAKSITLLLTNLKELLKTEKNKDFVSNINILLTLTKDYNESFTRVIKLINEKGSNENSGLIDSIKNSKEELLNLLRKKNPEMIIRFIDVIQFENEYEKNKSDISLENFGDGIISFGDSLRNSNEINLLDQYRNIFYQMVAIDNQINGEVNEFNQYIGKIEPVMNKYNLYIKEFTGFIKIRSLIITIIIFIFLIMVGLISTMITIKSIVSPIKKISISTGKIKYLAKRLSSIVNNNTIEITKITTIIEIVNDYINNQSVALNESNESIIKMADNVSFITEIAGSEKRQIHEMNMTLNETKEDLSRLIKFVCDIKDNSGIMLETSNIISIIADKTRILAFNAGIEAANSGASGKVFRIVAGEIKKLSDQINQNAGRIKDQLKKNFSLIEKSTESSKNVFNDFLEFSGKAEKTTLSIIEIIKKMQIIALEKNNVMDKIRNLVLINKKVNYSGNELNAMSIVLNENLAYLIDVKSNTYNAIDSIVEVINNMISDVKDPEINHYDNDNIELGLLKSYLNPDAKNNILKTGSGDLNKTGKKDKKLA